MSRWVRPPGPPMVWKIVDGQDGQETLKDGTKKPVKYSIQEIPKDEKRRKEVLDHLRTNYLPDEPLGKCLDLENEPERAEDYTLFWNYGLDQGITIGCYKLDSNGEIDELVGVNVLFVINKKTLEDFDEIKRNFKSKSYKKVRGFCDYVRHKVDVFKIYNVDKYIGSMSLCVSRACRGQKIGYHLLNTRSDIGKKYGVWATSTIFTGNPSQTQAARAGFEEIFSMDYADYVDDQGKRLFSNVKWTNCKIMSRKLP